MDEGAIHNAPRSSILMQRVPVGVGKQTSEANLLPDHVDASESGTPGSASAEWPVSGSLSLHRLFCSLRSNLHRPAHT